METVLVALLAMVVAAIVLGVKIVPQSQNWVVERFGRYLRTLEAGLHVVVPFVDQVRHRVDVLERQLPEMTNSTITSDNVTIEIKLAVLIRVRDAARSVYRIANLDTGIATTVTGTVRSVIGRMDLDSVQSNRRQIIDAIETELRQASEEWGVLISRVEVVDVVVDEETRRAMQMQLNAERERRAMVRKAEGEREATQLAADAQLYAANRQAEAKRVLAEAEAYAMNTIAAAIAGGGALAAGFEIQKQQVQAIGELAKGPSAKLVLVPTDLLGAFEGVVRSVVRKD